MDICKFCGEQYFINTGHLGGYCVIQRAKTVDQTVEVKLKDLEAVLSLANLCTKMFANIPCDILWRTVKMQAAENTLNRMNLFCQMVKDLK